MTKRTIQLLIAILMVTMACSSFTACVPSVDEVKVESLLLSHTEVTVTVGEARAISCTVLPEDATTKTVTWSSSNNAVATVNDAGEVTAISSGTCTIIASCGGVMATVNVMVKKKGPDFKKLYDTIDFSARLGWEVGSDGSYLMADTNAYDLDDYADTQVWTSIKKMNKELGLPDSLNKDMGQTTWSMGKQQEEFEDAGVKVSWTYHPDKGLEVTYKLLN